ncbi:MAG TPA: biotin/lipoyl-containing protein [Anaerolineae bacterium]
MRRYNIKVGQHEYTIDVQEMSADRFRVWIGDRELDVHIAGDQDIAEATITPEIVPIRGDGETVDRPSVITRPAAPQPVVGARVASQSAPMASAGAKDMTAPMPGTIVSVFVKPGDRVEVGQALLVLEAMKMKNTLRSTCEGVVVEVPVQNGQSVKLGNLLIRFAENAQ